MSQMLVPDGDYDFRLPPERGPRPVPKRVPVPDFGRKRRPPAPRLPPVPRLAPLRFIPGVGLGLGAAGLIDGLLPYPAPDPLIPPPNYCLARYCDDPPENWTGEIILSGTSRAGSSCILSMDCLSGQAIGGAVLEPGVGFDRGTVRFGLWWPYRLQSGVVRHKHFRSYYRTQRGTTHFGYQPVRYAGPLGRDANLTRASPSVPDPVPEPARAPPSRWQWNSGGPPLAPPRPHRREPPERGDKERKMRSQAARIGQALFRALDRISESAEVVDAVYEALPDDVKRRWERGRQSRRFLDQAGQYGIEGADWKLEALYHNWHRVDVRQAMKNILQNHVEDKIIGGAQRYLPNNVINAFDRELPGGKNISPEMAISNWVNDLFGG